MVLLEYDFISIPNNIQNMRKKARDLREIVSTSFVE